jgi:hypothetical protein
MKGFHFNRLAKDLINVMGDKKESTDKPAPTKSL